MYFIHVRKCYLLYSHIIDVKSLKKIELKIIKQKNKKKYKNITKIK